MKRLAGQSIVIIGGTSGIGLSATRACLREEACVVAVGRDDSYADAAFVELDRDSSSADLCVLRGDAADSQISAEAIALAVKQFGRLDGLYHVAGGSGRRLGDGRLHELSDVGIEATLQSNLASVLYSNRAATQQFLSQGNGGCVVNVSSVLADHPSPQFFGTVTYAAAKAAIVGLTRSAAATYASHNIRFNVIAPGLVQTPMASRAIEDEAVVEFVQTKQPLDGGRVGQPSDLDGAVVYLLSSESRFVTGQVLQVDGGWSVSEGRTS